MIQSDCSHMPDDVCDNGLEPVLVKDAVREPGRGRPDGVDAADLSSSVCFLLPPSMLKDRNQPDGAGVGVALPDALPEAKPPRSGDAPACNKYSDSPRTHTARLPGLSHITSKKQFT